MSIFKAFAAALAGGDKPLSPYGFNLVDTSPLLHVDIPEVVTKFDVRKTYKSARGVGHMRSVTKDTTVLQMLLSICNGLHKHMKLDLRTIEPMWMDVMHHTNEYYIKRNSDVKATMHLLRWYRIGFVAVLVKIVIVDDVFTVEMVVGKSELACNAMWDIYFEKVKELGV